MTTILDRCFFLRYYRDTYNSIFCYFKIILYQKLKLHKACQTGPVLIKNRSQSNIYFVKNKTLKIKFNAVDDSCNYCCDYFTLTSNNLQIWVRCIILELDLKLPSNFRLWPCCWNLIEYFSPGFNRELLIIIEFLVLRFATAL